MPAMEVCTAGLSRAVTENRAPARPMAASTSRVWNAESARVITSPVAPHARAVASASVTSRAAPRAELVGPRRSLLAAITGAPNGVDTVAISALSPFTPQ